MKNDNEKFYLAVASRSKAAGTIHAEVPQTDLVKVLKILDAEGQRRAATDHDLQKRYLTEEEAMELAQAALWQEKVVFAPIEQVLRQDFAQADIDEEIASDASTPYRGSMLYVLTNCTGQEGASMILRDDVMREITRELGPVYILPSSVHEVLIVPKEEAPCAAELETMVREINAHDVAEKDRLSDHVYESDTGKVAVVSLEKAEFPEQQTGMERSRL